MAKEKETSKEPAKETPPIEAAPTSEPIPIMGDPKPESKPPKAEADIILTSFKDLGEQFKKLAEKVDSALPKPITTQPAPPPEPRKARLFDEFDPTLGL